MEGKMTVRYILLLGQLRLEVKASVGEDVKNLESLSAGNSRKWLQLDAKLLWHSWGLDLYECPLAGE